MPSGLKRFQNAETLHFITFSCFHRFPLLEVPGGRWPGHQPATTLSAPFNHSFIVVEWETTHLNRVGRQVGAGGPPIPANEVGAPSIASFQRWVGEHEPQPAPSALLPRFSPGKAGSPHHASPSSAGLSPPSEHNQPQPNPNPPPQTSPRIFPLFGSCIRLQQHNRITSPTRPQTRSASLSGQPRRHPLVRSRQARPRPIAPPHPGPQSQSPPAKPVRAESSSASP